MEHEGRFFGSMRELERDVIQYTKRMSVAETVLSMQHMRLVFDDYDVSWVLILDRQDYQKIMGIQFAKMMFDVSVDREHVAYCLSRLRTPGRTGK